ncbi:hypothetical protein HDU97_005794 [Phlyctochytrium planicorne]|nr:hypothetical protein HDU97_005794 [Phlyctochytrium planicorne]
MSRAMQSAFQRLGPNGQAETAAAASSAFRFPNILGRLRAQNNGEGSSTQAIPAPHANHHQNVETGTTAIPIPIFDDDFEPQQPPAVAPLLIAIPYEINITDIPSPPLNPSLPVIRNVASFAVPPSPEDELTPRLAPAAEPLNLENPQEMFENGVPSMPPLLLDESTTVSANITSWIEPTSIILDAANDDSEQSLVSLSEDRDDLPGSPTAAIGQLLESTSKGKNPAAPVTPPISPKLNARVKFSTEVQSIQSNAAPKPSSGATEMNQTVTGISQYRPASPKATKPLQRPPRAFTDNSRSNVPIRRDMSWLTRKLVTGFPPSFGIPDSIIQAILYFDNLPPVGRFKAELLTRLALKFDRFRSVPVYHTTNTPTMWRRLWTRRGSATVVQWERIEMFNVHPHVILATVRDDEGLDRYLKGLAGIQLDKSMPLWNVHMVQNMRGKSCIVFNIHHAIGDGLSMMLAATSLFTNEEGDSIRHQSSPLEAHITPLASTSSAPAPSSQQPAQEPLKPSTLQTIAQTAWSTYTFLKGYLRAATLPLSPRDTLTTSLHSTDKTWRTRRHTITTSARSTRSVVICDPIRLDAVKEIKNALSREGAKVTVNDVMASALAGVFRRYLLEFEEGFTEGVKDPFSGVRMRALIPFALGQVGRYQGGAVELEIEDDEILADALHNK